MTEPIQGQGASGSGGEGSTADTGMAGGDTGPVPSPTPAYPTYHPGHVKRNPATNEVALRTGFAEDMAHLAALAWCVATPGRGARTAPTSEVAGWDDLYFAPDPTIGVPDATD